MLSPRVQMLMLRISRRVRATVSPLSVGSTTTVVAPGVDGLRRRRDQMATCSSSSDEENRWAQLCPRRPVAVARVNVGASAGRGASGPFMVIPTCGGHRCVRRELLLGEFSSGRLTSSGRAEVLSLHEVTPVR